MELIDKGAIVAKIDRFIEMAKAERVLYPKTILAAKNYLLIEDYKKLLSFINTLEVKEVDIDEVDIDEAARKWEDKVYLEKGWQNEYGTPHAPFSEIGNAFREGAKFILKAQKGE